MGELFTLYGATDGSNTTGTFDLYGDLLQAAVNYVRIPKGMKAKIWCKLVSGAPVDVSIQYTHNVTVTSPTYITITTESLANAGEESIEKRRPIVLRGFTGKEAFKTTWSQSSAAKSYVQIEVELTEDL